MTRALGRMPLYFIENRGQLDSRVAYYVQGRDTTLYFTAEGMTLVQTEQRHGENGAAGRLEKASLGRGIPETPDPGSRWVVKLDFVGANPNPKIEAGDPTPAVISYFKGPKENWKAGLSTYGLIVYSDLWPGIDLVYSGTTNRLKYTFLVKPGADPAQVRLAYRGVKGIRLNGAGQLEVETPAGVLQDDRPYAYQEVEGRRVEVSADYSLDRASAGGPHRYGFALGSYDRSKPLVLDPAVFVYCGYIGGGGGNGIAVDSSGNAYVTGFTQSTEATFPVSIGPDLTFNGGSDAFVAKINAAGTALVYCGYIGGSGNDYGFRVAVDSSGNAYVTGFTASSEATFPVNVGPSLTYNGGSSDAFVAKVNAAGTALVYCGYIGGSGYEEGDGIAVDGLGNAYITGITDSTEATFPVTVGPDLTYNGGADAFVAKVNAAGTALVYCGYIGGSGDEIGNGIAVDSSGNAYVTGYTNSTEATFPVSVGPDLTWNGGNDAFVAKVNTAGTALVYCGYIGGNGSEVGRGIAVDSSGNAYVVGSTESTEATFPVSVGPDLTWNGGNDAFVAKVNTAGTALVYCGYIGGGGDDFGDGIALDSSGNAYVTGYTASTEASFPVTVGPDLTYNGGTSDAFVAKVNAAGTALVYCGYIGGNTYDQGNGIAVDSLGNAYVTGLTDSTEATFPVTVGPDLTFNGSLDAFVAKIGSSSTPPSRFQIQVDWRVPSQGRSGVGTEVSLSSDTRYFWFFDSANVELVIKVLDARVVNGYFWVFYGALSNVEYTIRITDTVTGEIKTYFNPDGRLASVADVTAFHGGSAGSLDADTLGAIAAPDGGAAASVSPGRASAAEAACVADALTLCLAADRFQLRVNWSVPSQARSGVGTAVPVTPDTGTFWFFNSANVELIIKVLDARVVNGKFWVFYGALSNVQYTITVTDTQSGAVKTYTNPDGTLASVADTSAF